jgi:hypothetical protein
VAAPYLKIATVGAEVGIAFTVVSIVPSAEDESIVQWPLRR